MWLAIHARWFCWIGLKLGHGWVITSRLTTKNEEVWSHSCPNRNVGLVKRIPRPQLPLKKHDETPLWRYTVLCRLSNPHTRHPIARQWRRNMGCDLWFQSVIYILLLSLYCCLWYHVILGRITVAPVYKCSAHMLATTHIQTRAECTLLCKQYFQERKLEKQNLHFNQT